MTAPTTTTAPTVTITVDPSSELGRALAQPTRRVVLESGGVRYRVEPERATATDDLFANYDPERIRDALRRSAGALKGVDVEALKRELRAQRGHDDEDSPS